MVQEAVAFDELRNLGVGGAPSREELLDGLRFFPVETTCAPVRCCGLTIGLVPIGINLVGERVIAPYCPPPPAPTPDQRAMGDVMKWSFIQALREAPPITTQPSPIESPGFRGRRFKITSTVILSSNTFPANLGFSTAIFLQSGAQGPLSSRLSFFAPAIAVPIITTNNPAIPSTLLSFTLPESMAGVAESFFVATQSTDAASFLFLSVMRSGTIIQPEINLIDALQGVPLGIPIGPGETISIMGRLQNQDITSTVRVQLDMWLTPTRVTDDTLYSRVSRKDPSWPTPERCA